MYPAGVFGQANHTNPMRNKHTRTKPQSHEEIVFVFFVSSWAPCEVFLALAFAFIRKQSVPICEEMHGKVKRNTSRTLFSNQMDYNWLLTVKPSCRIDISFRDSYTQWLEKNQGCLSPRSWASWCFAMAMIVQIFTYYLQEALIIITPGLKEVSSTQTRIFSNPWSRSALLG